jgi:hypothetical protein
VVAVSIIGCNITQATSIIATQHSKDLQKKKSLGFQACIRKKKQDLGRTDDCLPLKASI